MNRLMSVTAIAVLAAVLPAAAQQSGMQAAQGTMPPTIVTVGEATLHRAPNQAFVTVAVETRARLPKDAQRLNAEAMTTVQQRVGDAGVPKDAVRTTGYSIQQEFDFPNGRRVPREYVARNGIEIRLDAVERVGEMLDLVVQGGATSVSGVRFELSDRSVVERDVLRHAVEDALARADALAAGAGRAVDRVMRIDDVRQSRIGPPQPVLMMQRGAADAVPTPIESGLIEVSAQVTLTVSIK